ncbi:MAG: flavodoxin family protein [Proteobacteria bacterium]|nr:flavodoxin family protein [Pseudomonadota bacterium]
MKILVINGNAKQGGFTAEALAIVSSYLKAKDVEVQNLRLADADIKECIGCFQCLKTGKCALTDDMDKIRQAMLEADGFVIGSPVRNGLTTACYKRFYERITYLLGFTLALEDKHTLAISSVGFMGGKTVNKKLVALQDVCHTRLSDFIFCKVGIPNKVRAPDIESRLEKATEKLIYRIKNRCSRGIFERIFFAVDRMVMRKFIFNKNPEQYDYVIECWKKKNYM